MDSYLLLLREDPSQYAALSPAEMGEIIERYRAWTEALAAQGRLVGGQKLADEGGKRLRAGAAGQGPIVTDGPYIESKDVIGGTFIVRAASYDEAIALVADCPHLGGDNVIELRRIEIE